MLLALTEGMSPAVLLGYVVATDGFIWGLAFPFDLYCGRLIGAHALSSLTLLLILLVNLLFVVLMGLAVTASVALAKRGLRIGRKRSV